MNLLAQCHTVDKLHSNEVDQGPFKSPATAPNLALADFVRDVGMIECCVNRNLSTRDE